MTEQPDYREWLVRTHHQATLDFDRVGMTLAGGALALSITFADTIAPRPMHGIGFLLASWIGFGTTLLAIFASLLTSQFAQLKMIEQLDNSLDPKRWGGIARVATTGCNLVAAVALIFGTSMLIVFAFQNAGR